MSALSPELRAIVGDWYKLDRTIAELRRYSLVQTDKSGGALSIHRLLQATIRDALSLEEQRQWSECAVKVISLAFPMLEVATLHKTWSKCQRYFQQANACLDLIKHWQITNSEATQLLTKLGRYLEERTEVKQAERLYQLALELDKQSKKEQNLIIEDFYRLALFYEKQDKFRKAEACYKQSMLLVDASELDNYKVLLGSYLKVLRKLNKEEDARKLREQVKGNLIEAPVDSRKRIIVNDDSRDIDYDENVWTYDPKRRGDYGHDAHAASKQGAAFRYTFIGYGIEILSDPSSFQGEIDIFIDGKYVQSVNSDDFEGQSTQSIIFGEVDLDQEEHRLEVKLASGTFLLDALAYYVKEDDIEASLGV